MNITLNINGETLEVDCSPSETLLATLRRSGYFGAKFGDEQGLSGSDTVLLDDRPVNAGSLLAAQAMGHAIRTIEGLGEYPEQGWRPSEGLHPLQRAFAENGAIQCGYCTPAQILAAKSLLDKNPNPTEDEVREAIAGVLCRCTGYLKPVQAVMRAAAPGVHPWASTMSAASSIGQRSCYGRLYPTLSATRTCITCSA